LEVSFLTLGEGSSGKLRIHPKLLLNKSDREGSRKEKGCLNPKYPLEYPLVIWNSVKETKERRVTVNRFDVLGVFSVIFTYSDEF